MEELKVHNRYLMLWKFKNNKNALEIAKKIFRVYSERVLRVLRFYEQRKYVNKTEKKWARRCTTKQLGLLTTGRDMHLLTWKWTFLTDIRPRSRCFKRIGEMLSA